MVGLEELEKLFQNKLLLQYLAGTGADVSAFGADTGKGFQPTNINAITQQNIKAQNTAAAQKKWMEWLQHFLGPDESKATLSNKGITMSIPGSDLGSIFQGTQKGGVWEGLAPPLGTPKVGTGGAAAVNPFVSSQPEFSASDLAGLTPEDISNALAGPLSAVGMKQKLGLEREQLANKSVQDIFDMMYKGQLIRESEHRISKPEKEDPLEQPFPVTVPDIGEVSLRQWNALPEDMRRYALFVHGSVKSLGDKDPLSKEEFEDLKPTEQERLLKHFEKDPKLFSLAKEYKKSGATVISLGAKVEEKEALSDVERKNKVLDPGFSQSVLEDLQKDIRKWRSTAEADAYAEKTGKSFEEARTEIQKAKHREAMDRQIKQVYPTAVWKRNGWYVGDKKMVRDPYVE